MARNFPVKSGERNTDQRDGAPRAFALQLPSMRRNRNIRHVGIEPDILRLQPRKLARARAVFIMQAGWTAPRPSRLSVRRGAEGALRFTRERRVAASLPRPP